jgi:hypothetical protein
LQVVVINSIIELLGIPMQCRSNAEVKAYKREEKRIKAGRDQARGSRGPPLVSINTVVRNAPLFAFQNSFPSSTRPFLTRPSL